MRTAQTEIIIEKHVFENRQSKHLAYTHMCIAAQHTRTHTPRPLSCPASTQTYAVGHKQEWLLSGSEWLRKDGATSGGWLRTRALGNS